MTTAQFKELTPKVVLGVAAHPDDLDFTAAGTMAVFAEAGAEIYYLILTDGSSGSADPNANPDELVRTRQAEQQAALATVGRGGIEFLTYDDGQLQVSMDVKRDIVKAIRTVKPDVVVAMDPAQLYSTKRGMINHPDHRAAGQATLDAVYPLARDHLSFPELYEAGLEPHKVKTVLLSNFDAGNYCVDISRTIDKKLAALAAHASQIPDQEKLQIDIRERAAEVGLETGCQYAECFIRIDLAE